MPDRQSGRNIVRITDASGTERASLPAGIGGVAAFAFSPDGKTLVASTYDADVRVWATASGELLRLINELPTATFAMSFSPDGRYLATGGVDRILYLWDARTWKLAKKLEGQPEMISALAFSADGRSLVTGGFNEITVKHPVSVLRWDVAGGRVTRKWPVPGRVRSVAFSADGESVSAVCGDETLQLGKTSA